MRAGLGTTWRRTARGSRCAGGRRRREKSRETWPPLWWAASDHAAELWGSSSHADRMGRLQGVRTRRRGRALCRAVRVQGATSRPTLRPRGASSRRGLVRLSLDAHALEILRSQWSPGSRPDGVWVSMVLTSQAHLRRTPKNNRRIPAIPTGNIDVRSINVSAVDTVSRRSESGVLAAEPGAFVTGPPHRSLTAVCAGARRSWFDTGSAPSRPESAYSTRVGIY